MPGSIKFIFLLFFLFGMTELWASSSKQTDSLIEVFQKEKNETKKLKHLYNVCHSYNTTGDFENYHIWLEKGIAIAIKTKNIKYQINFTNSLVFCLIMEGNISKADSVLEKNYLLIKKTDFPREEFYYHRWKGMISLRNGQYEDALKQYIKAGDLAREINNDTIQIAAFEDLGLAYYYTENYEQAAVFWEKQLSLQIKINDEKNEICGVLSNLGLVYANIKNYKKATEKLNLALNYAVYDKEKSNIYTNIGKIEFEKGNFPAALIAMENAYKYLLSGSGEKGHEINILNNLCVLYAKNGKKEKSIECGMKGYKLAKEMAQLDYLIGCVNNLSEAYRIFGDFEKAYEYKDEELILKDSLKSNERLAGFDELSEKYQSRLTRDSLQISNQKNEIEKSNSAQLKSESERKSIIIWGAILALLLSAGLLFLVFRGRNTARKVNLLLTEKNLLIEQKNKDITDSINYAKRIQNAILTNENQIQKYFPESFLLYLPKDIIAGDFYFFEVTKTHIFYAVADCTGHGVPGAMVSVVCSNALSRCVKEFGLTDPGKILDKTKILITETFDKSVDNVKDGMDISICVFPINYKEKTLFQMQWAGAFNSLLYVRSNELIEVDCNKHSVCKDEISELFTTHSIEIKKGDIIFQYTDGYADQFGGPKSKKYKYSNLKKILLENHSTELSTQKNILISELKKWQGDLEQVDDICIAGIKI